MPVRETDIVEWSAGRGKSIFLEGNKFTSEWSELGSQKDIKSRSYFDIYAGKQNEIKIIQNPKKNRVQVPKKNLPIAIGTNVQEKPNRIPVLNHPNVQCP